MWLKHRSLFSYTKNQVGDGTAEMIASEAQVLRALGSPTRFSGAFQSHRQGQLMLPISTT